MSMCPVCNQLHTVAFRCPECGNLSEDLGKLSDYFDDYSPYVDSDGLKLENGYPADFKDGQCPHMYYCRICRHEMIMFISEWNPEELQ
ncbi:MULTISPECIES: hypothetical protein [Fictibacillus]|uniref:Uncharacterized protein n=1 Tax=Fictibacillus terranigra TaxID=3058424 RepID=A0ABT8ECW0_9BACL|nr:hypothetical protein [Fictibacillus sp. CENA-BCM004]MDN4075766.1 hypothetical protein [Fictibacillus sp. CENA-BCM004]